MKTGHKLKMLRSAGAIIAYWDPPILYVTIMDLEIYATDFFRDDPVYSPSCRSFPALCPL